MLLGECCYCCRQLQCDCDWIEGLVISVVVAVILFESYEGWYFIDCVEVPLPPGKQRKRLEKQQHRTAPSIHPSNPLFIKMRTSTILFSAAAMLMASPAMAGECEGAFFQFSKMSHCLSTLYHCISNTHTAASITNPFKQTNRTPNTPNPNISQYASK